ncbi:DUF6519 domain-containing protein [Sorangium sp. So ce1097]|uniref:DUF6519 domain-containing protein n=1 Tax=Sorangium sp. So ce1097 TaxID=3133330 RepID=UPI003F5D5968
MGTVDITRSAFDPRKRYQSVRMQQGRVTLDDDFNEAERIQDEDERRALLDIIGPTGSADDGFRIVNGRLNPLGELTFDILPGTLYLGGLRLWNHAGDAYAEQEDWLQQPASLRAVPTDGQVNLVYLEAWQQAVTAVEDAELFEAALAGPDTSTRVRTMWRVRLAPGGSDCASAWDLLRSQFQADGLGVIDETGERVADARLTVGYEGSGRSDDLCSPPVAGGYLGAENQAIRVQLVDANHFTWGFDNASPLYRVQIGADGSTITLETEPKDQAHWPLAGQIVEILPWSAVLPNDEKLAELSGHLSRVSGSYDPELRTIKLTTPVPAGFGEAWKGREHKTDLGAPYFFMRVWNRGDDQLSPVAIPFTPATSVPLGTTGLNVTFTGTQFVKDDFWIIAARPETPDQVVPWDLEVGRGVHGVRRFYAPLALVQWHVTRAGVSFDVLSDCRVPFQPLTRLRGCCTYTVGDRKQSWGQFDSIQEAINNLPPGGGKICVLPGEYVETVRIDRRHDITIEGCGRRSRLIAPAGREAGTCAILITGSQDITIRSLYIDGGDRPGVVMLDAQELVRADRDEARGGGSLFSDIVLVDAAAPRRARALNILLEELEIHVKGLPAVAALGGRNITLRQSSLLAGTLDRPIGGGAPDNGRWPLVFMLSDDVLIEENRILAAVDPRDQERIDAGAAPTFTQTAMGGVQIGGGSERVEIRRNVITGGNGHGVTLGSWAWVPAPVRDTNDFSRMAGAWTMVAPGFHFIINDEGCVEIVWDPPRPTGDDGAPLVPVSMGALRELRILDNAIARMGGAGVGVARYFDLSERDELITVDRLTIERNRIRQCLRLPIPELPEPMRDLSAAGAIALADGEIVVIRDNTIEENGRTHVDPVCGVYALRGAGVSVERNRIIDNAPRTTTGERARPGLRGGVVLTALRPPATTIRVDALGEIQRQNGVPAARIHDNVVVVPEGRGLILVGEGAMVVTDNQLTSRGVGLANLGMVEGNATSGRGSFSTSLDALGGVTVAVINTGWSNELRSQLLKYERLSEVEVDPAPGLDPRPPIAAGGDVMFSGNQVKLDLIEAGIVAVMSSVLCISFDDTSFHGNQCEVEQEGDLLLVNLLLLSWSFRVNDNRFEEALARDREVTVGYSTLCVGPMALATGNVATRCMLVGGSLRVFSQNIILLEASSREACAGTRFAGDVGTVEPTTDPAWLEFAPRFRRAYRGPDARTGMERVRYSVNRADRTRGQALELMARAERARASQTAREVSRAVYRYGAGAAEAARAETAARTQAAVTDHVAAEAQRARTPAPRVDQEIVLVHGRAVDARGLGVAGLAATLRDRRREPHAEARTDDNGYFKLELKSDLLREIGAVMLVLTKEDRELARVELTDLQPGQSRYLELQMEAGR